MTGMPRLVGLTGYKESGKDTCGEILRAQLGHRPVAIGDALRSMALTINPYLPPEGGRGMRLSAAVDMVGWSAAKKGDPEVQRLLHAIGDAARTLDPTLLLQGADGLHSLAHRRSAPLAETLHRVALTIDPYLPHAGTRGTRLSSAVSMVGWRLAKDGDPEVRRLLQHIGDAVRAVDPHALTRPVREQVSGAGRWVVTDVRTVDEVTMVRELGGVVLRVQRPGRDPASNGDTHSTETGLDGLELPLVVNDGSLADLEGALMSALVREVHSGAR